MKLRLRNKLKIKVTPRFLEKINNFNLSYYEIFQRYSASIAKPLEINQKADNGINLESLLLDQIAQLTESEKDKENIRKMINYLDNNGLFSNWVNIKNDIKDELNISEQKAIQYLTIIQGLEPEGIGARDSKEFLEIQICNYDFEDLAFKELLLKILKRDKDLENHRLAKIAEDLQVSLREVNMGISFIKNNLSHILPGKLYNTQKTQFIYPSAKITIKDNKFMVEILEKYDFVNNASLSKDLNDRRNLLKKILEEFCKHQSIVFFAGIEYLSPVTQKEIADEIGVSYSIISRLVNKKYVVVNDKNVLIKNLLQRKINNYQKTKYFLKNFIKTNISKTDMQIRDLLVKQGIKISRRTVNYYKNLFNL